MRPYWLQYGQEEQAKHHPCFLDQSGRHSGAQLVHWAGVCDGNPVGYHGKIRNLCRKKQISLGVSINGEYGPRCQKIK